MVGRANHGQRRCERVGSSRKAKRTRLLRTAPVTIFTWLSQPDVRAARLPSKTQKPADHPPGAVSHPRCTALTVRPPPARLPARAPRALRVGELCRARSTRREVCCRRTSFTFFPSPALRASPVGHPRTKARSPVRPRCSISTPGWPMRGWRQQCCTGWGCLEGGCRCQMGVRSRQGAAAPRGKPEQR